MRQAGRKVQTAMRVGFNNETKDNVPPKSIFDNFVDHDGVSHVSTLVVFCLAIPLTSPGRTPPPRRT